MSLTTSTSRINYTGNGVVVDYPFPYLVYDASHLAVYLDGVLQSSGYSVSAIPSTGATPTVTFSTPPANGVLINILRTVPNTQQVTLAVAGAFPAKTVEKALDLDVMGLQQFSEHLDRSLTVPVSEASIPTLPTLTTRLNKYLAFNSSGSPIAVDPATASGTSVLATGSVTARLLADRAADWFNALDYAVTNAGAETGATITTFLAAVNAAGGGVAYFPKGTYSYSTSPNFAVDKVSIVADRGTVFTHTGTGVAFNLDGGSGGSGILGNDYINITVSGNSNSTHGFYARAIHHALFSHIKVRGCATTGSAIRVEWCVLGTWINPTVSSNEGAFTSVPLHGMYITRRGSGTDHSSTQTLFTPIFEGLTGVGGFGLYIDYAYRITSLNGTSESNANGVNIGPNGAGLITIDSLDLESNTTRDIVVDGTSGANYNTFTNLYSLGTVEIKGISNRNTFRGGRIENLICGASAHHNEFTSVAFVTSRTDSSTAGNTYIACTDPGGVDLGIRYAIGTWTPSVGGSATYTAQTGRYTKMGRIVTVHCHLVINAIGTGSTSLISGLPFTIRQVAPTGAVAFDALSASVVFIMAEGTFNDTTVRLFSMTAAGTVMVANAVIGNGTTINFTLIYETDN